MMDLSKLADNIMNPPLPCLTHLGRINGKDILHYTGLDGVTHSLAFDVPKKELLAAVRNKIAEIERVE